MKIIFQKINQKMPLKFAGIITTLTAHGLGFNCRDKP